MANKMKASEIYLRAAEIIDAGLNRRGKYLHGACDVLGAPEKYYGYLDRLDLKAEFYDIFVNEKYHLMHEIMPIEEAQKIRVLALCLMAAISADEEKRK